jgi:hypothetical protein
MPLFVSAPIKACDPEINEPDDDVTLLNIQEVSESGGREVEMRIQLGVYDVQGVCDESRLSPEIPIVDLPEPEQIIVDVSQ